MAAINRDASRFLTLVAQQFDRRHFPGVETLPVVPQVEDDLFSAPTPFSALTYIDTLPRDIQVILHNKTDNFAQWLQSTRFLEAPLENAGQESVRKAAIEASAKELLLKLHKPLGYVNSYSEQLLMHVFQDAFNRVDGDARPDERENIIDLATRLQPALDNLPFTFRRVKYKVEFTVANLLNHTLTKIALTYVAYRVGQWAQPRIYHLLAQTVIPRGVNYLINHAHLSVIHVVSGGVALVQFAYFHYWKATFTFFAAKYVAGYIHPLLKQGVTVIESFAFFPSRVINWLVMSPFFLLTSSWQVQSSLAASLNSSKDRAQAQHLEEGGMKAHRAWMELMQRGIKADLLPRQPVATPAA